MRGHVAGDAALKCEDRDGDEVVLIIAEGALAARGEHAEVAAKVAAPRAWKALGGFRMRSETGRRWLRVWLHARVPEKWRIPLPPAGPTNIRLGERLCGRRCYQ